MADEELGSLVSCEFVLLLLNFFLKIAFYFILFYFILLAILHFSVNDG
jgi:hypothetical protein